MNLYSEYYGKVLINRQNFENLLLRLQQEQCFEQKVKIAECAAKYFVYNHTGYFTSSVLESFFVGFARQIKVDLSEINYKKNTFLHVLTEGHNTGGHTRVVERWIDHAPSDQTHSVAVIQPVEEKLTLLEKAVASKHGEYVCFDNNLSIQEKVIKLRLLAMTCEYIVLHTHMEDPTPLIAFGCEDFTRPVLLYNHASHMPWLGLAVSDLILDLNEYDEITSKMRNVSKTFHLGVPCSQIVFSDVDKTVARQHLKLPIDKKIIVTSGSGFKYRTICGYSFAEYIKQIIDDDVICYAIGIEPDNPEWKRAEVESDGRIVPLGYIGFNNGYMDYLAAADLYLDSYPIGGYAATIDAISVGVPVVSLKSTFPQMNYLMKTSAYCQSVEEFICKAKKVLSDRTYANELYEELKISLLKHQSKEAWNERIETLLRIAPENHKVRDMSNCSDHVEINDYSVANNVMYNSKFLEKNSVKLLSDNELDHLIEYGALYKRKKLLGFIEISNYRKNHFKTKVVKVFGMTVCRYTKKC